MAVAFCSSNPTKPYPSDEREKNSGGEGHVCFERRGATWLLSFQMREEGRNTMNRGKLSFTEELFGIHSWNLYHLVDHRFQRHLDRLYNFS